MVYLIRNKRTGWVGGVTEKMYHDRMKHPDEYEDVTPARDGDPLPAETWTPAAHVVQEKSPGWFNVVNGHGKPVNEKALRQSAAVALADQLNGGK